jgi:hypothetical protein
LNQTNLLAIVVNGTQIDMYVNNQFVDKTTDDAYTVGQLGILAANKNNGTADVIASDARVWSLS